MLVACLLGYYYYYYYYYIEWPFEYCEILTLSDRLAIDGIKAQHAEGTELPRVPTRLIVRRRTATASTLTTAQLYWRPRHLRGFSCWVLALRSQPPGGRKFQSHRVCPSTSNDAKIGAPGRLSQSVCRY